MAYQILPADESLLAEIETWLDAEEAIAGKRFAEIGRHCPDCIKEAAFHRVWWDLQGFATCPIHDTPLTKFKRPDNNEYVRFTFHGIAQNKITSPPVLSARGRDSYEGYLLQTLGAVEGSTSRPLLDDQPLDLRIRVIQMVGRFLSNRKTATKNPPMRPTSMARGFDALKHDQTHLEDQFSEWLVANHTPDQLRHAKLDHFGYFHQMPMADGPLKDRVVAAKLTVIDNPNQSHPYTLTQVSQRIGLPNWQAANHLLNRIKDEKGIDLRSSDNRYHCKIKTGNKASSMTRKWSHEGVALLKKVQDGEEYEVGLQ